MKVKSVSNKVCVILIEIVIYSYANVIFLTYFDIRPYSESDYLGRADALASFFPDELLGIRSRRTHNPYVNAVVTVN